MEWKNTKTQVDGQSLDCLITIRDLQIIFGLLGNTFLVIQYFNLKTNV